MPRLSRRAGPCTLLALAACGSFEGTLAEFDLVTGLDERTPQRGLIAYEDNVTAWRAVAEPAELSVPDLALANPSGFAREKLIDLVEYARDDLDAAGRVAPRLLLIAIADPNALNQLEALEGIADLLRDLDVRVVERAIDVAGARERSVAVDTLAALVPNARDGAELETGARERYLETLAVVAAGPMPSPLDDIRVLHLLSAAARQEPDGELRAAAFEALRETIANSLSRMLVGVLRSPDVRQRVAAARRIYQLGDSQSLPLLLWALTRNDAGIYRYPLIESERRALLRLCSQTGGEVLFMRFADGPRPIEFIYDTAARDEVEGLRLIALETMARCLERPISFEQVWADDWWREFALSEG